MHNPHWDLPSQIKNKQHIRTNSAGMTLSSSKETFIAKIKLKIKNKIKKNCKCSNSFQKQFYTNSLIIYERL